MSKVLDSLKTPSYVATEYLTLDEFLKHYSLSTAEIAALSTEQKQKYVDWVANANRKVESALYRFKDIIPLDVEDEAYTYAKSMAMHWAQYEKSADEDAPNKRVKKELYDGDKQDLVRVLQSRGEKSTVRTVSGSSFEDDAPLPFSQSYGVKGLL